MLSYAIVVSAAALPIESRFEASDEGWTQVNLGADYRFLDDIAFGGDCSPHQGAGAFRCCDPDSGTWMYEAPAAFHGDLSSALDGKLSYRIWWAGEGVVETEYLVPHVVLMNTNSHIGLARIFASEPPMNSWTTNTITLNEGGGWLFMDDTTPMEELPAATRAQVAAVLAGVTSLRIRGEFITGNDEGALDDVRITGPSGGPAPRLSIRLLPGQRVELSWSDPAAEFTLHSCDPVNKPAEWAPLSTPGGSSVQLDATGQPRLFRLQRNF